MKPEIRNSKSEIRKSQIMWAGSDFGVRPSFGFRVSALGFHRGSGTQGFTLAEVLAALVFMAIVIPVALEGISIASRAGEVAARKGAAALVAERVLAENIITTNWDKTVQNGTIRQGIRDFRWTLRSEPWNEDYHTTDLRLLSVEVLFSAQGQDYSVKLSTLVDNSSPYSQTNSLP